MKVLKFGGTSVGSLEALRRAAAIVRQELPAGGLVVVSALSGTTDLLLEAIRLAAGGDGEGALACHAALIRRHEGLARELGLEAELRDAWRPLLEGLGRSLEGMAMLGEASPRARDGVLAAGEGLAARLLAVLLAREGLPAQFRDVREVLKTDARHGRARPDLARTHAAAGAWRAHLAEGRLFVTQGFLGEAPDGAPATLGRGGSDTSAALLGEALGASDVQIWTDVDGVLSADPGLVPGARSIPEMGLVEAAALSAFGAKVLHGDALAPVARTGLSLVVANTHRPAASRTVIRRETPLRGCGEITSVAYKEGLALLRFPVHARLEELLQAAQDMEEAGAVRYGLLSAPDGSLLVVRAETPAAEARLKALEASGVSCERGWAVVALVGEGLRLDPDAALRALAFLERESVGALLTGNAGLSVAFLVPESRLSVLIPRLHARCVEGETSRLELCLLGTGLVGGRFLEQLQRLRALEPGLASRVRLAALADSRRMLLAPEGLDPATAREALAARGEPLDLEALRAFGARLEHPVLVDCTASQAVAEACEAFAEAGFHLVGANKRTSTLPMASQRRLREALARRGRAFRCETHVGAGLPVLGTLEDLRKGGDVVHRVEGILSGSLSCLYGLLDQGLPLREAVRRAREAGFTEPDPWEDLSGIDVARKALILHRELGGTLDLDGVVLEGALPPEALEGGDAAAFQERLERLEAPLRQRLEALRAEGKVLRYVATVTAEACRVAPVAVDAEHPFAAVRDGENAVVFHTDAYHPRPLVVRGYGAGAAVTAGGLLADVLKLEGGCHG